MRARSPAGELAEHKARMLARTLEEIQNLGLPLIVEGKKDERALRELGLANSIVRAQGVKNIEKKVRARGAIILTDLDDDGDALAERLSSVFALNGIKPELEYRRRLRYLLGIRHFEDINSRMQEFYKRNK